MDQIRKLCKEMFHLINEINERTVSTSNARILLDDVIGLYEDLNCLAFLNGLYVGWG